MEEILRAATQPSHGATPRRAELDSDDDWAGAATRNIESGGGFQRFDFASAEQGHWFLLGDCCSDHDVLHC
jgi:hypothetical protein